MLIYIACTFAVSPPGLLSNKIIGQNYAYAKNYLKNINWFLSDKG